MPTRREFLRATALTAAGGMFASSFAVSGTPFDFLGVASADDVVLVDGSGPVGSLGGIVEYLIDPAQGLERRLDFNRHPERVRASLSAGEMARFLTFDRRQVSVGVLEHVSDRGFTVSDVDAYADWLRSFAGWSFAPDEEQQHRIGIAPSGAAVQYPWPKCQVYRVEVDALVNKVTVHVYAQGILSGATLRIVNDDDDATVTEWTGVEPDQGSTFRYGRMTRSAQLPPGRYRAVVVNELGDDTRFVIDTPGTAFDIAG